MASNIPTRRTTRTTRATALKDNENADARPSKLISRAKPPSSSAATTSVATRATAASKAKAAATTADVGPQGKRKRAALGDVTKPGNDENKTALARKAKEKGKEKTEEPAPKAKAAATSSTATTAGARVPLRTVGGTATGNRRGTKKSTTIEETQKLEEVKEEVEVVEEDAMIVDPPTGPVIGHRRKVSTRTTKVETTIITGPSSRPADVPAATRKPNVRTIPAHKQDDDDDDEETHRVYKKRRTSSEPADADAFEESHLKALSEDAFDKQIKEAVEELEADPEANDWDDLDAEDADDPLMVSEYVVEIFEYLKKVEQTTMPHPNYMENQKELAWKMRGILMDWLIQVHFRFRLLPETLFLCCNIIDRFLSARVVSIAKLQLVGVACMFIASKTEEIVSPSVVNFLHCADSSYSEQEILQAERYILKTLDWNLSYPNPIHFLRRVSKADEYDVQARTIGKYFIEISCLEWRLLPAPPSLLAAASIWLARLVLGREEWTPNLAHYSSYPESALVPTANIMLNYVLRPMRHPTFYKKYASKKYMKASTFVRAWALDKWPEGSQVSLKDELPGLREEISVERERMAAAGFVEGEEVYEEEETHHA
ncbi:hypothetical protein JAAARDRAFT_56150 [Jaapia argillacea MUCL 33604]|uniref:Cyclin N-terminal domain-containing protein n=1 Tax=Jaapia argillacea MUCL 33604 TaxID=933084 RepID=A0A067Q9J9_9AGAM|nr:hypothetical protein JAAARDRAFT_56150 [Jaapia argillacea MUCL 33604]